MTDGRRSDAARHAYRSVSTAGAGRCAAADAAGRTVVTMFYEPRAPRSFESRAVDECGHDQRVGERVVVRQGESLRDTPHVAATARCIVVLHPLRRGAHEAHWRTATRRRPRLADGRVAHQRGQRRRRDPKHPPRPSWMRKPWRPLAGSPGAYRIVGTCAQPGRPPKVSCSRRWAPSGARGAATLLPSSSRRACGWARARGDLPAWSGMMLRAASGCRAFFPRRGSTRCLRAAERRAALLRARRVLTGAEVRGMRSRLRCRRRVERRAVAVQNGVHGAWPSLPPARGGCCMTAATLRWSCSSARPPSARASPSTPGPRRASPDGPGRSERRPGRRRSLDADCLVLPPASSTCHSPARPGGEESETAPPAPPPPPSFGLPAVSRAEHRPVATPRRRRDVRRSAGSRLVDVHPFGAVPVGLACSGWPSSDDGAPAPGAGFSDTAGASRPRRHAPCAGYSPRSTGDRRTPSTPLPRARRRTRGVAAQLGWPGGLRGGGDHRRPDARWPARPGAVQSARVFGPPIAGCGPLGRRRAGPAEVPRHLLLTDAARVRRPPHKASPLRKVTTPPRCSRHLPRAIDAATDHARCTQYKDNEWRRPAGIGVQTALSWSRPASRRDA